MEPLVESRSRAQRQGMLPDLNEVHGRHRLRFASSASDLQAIFELRFEVFNRELGEGLESSLATGLDRDPFDAQCHHLLVEEESTGRVVGTYRLQVAEMAEGALGFYSASEFDLSPLLAEVGAEAVELGRACVARDQRNQAVLFMLWRGLAAYALWNQRRYLFGCSSLTSRDPRQGLALYDHLGTRGHLHPHLRLQPLPGFACAGAGSTAGVPPSIPTLFAIYLRHGARVCSLPAIDHAFGTIDFLTLLDLRRMDERTFGMFARGLERAR